MWSESLEILNPYEATLKSVSDVQTETVTIVQGAY